MIGTLIGTEIGGVRTRIPSFEKSANNASFGLLITPDGSGILDDPRIVSLPLSTFMLLR